MTLCIFGQNPIYVRTCLLFCQVTVIIGLVSGSSTTTSNYWDDREDYHDDREDYHDDREDYHDDPLEYIPEHLQSEYDSVEAYEYDCDYDSRFGPY